MDSRMEEETMKQNASNGILPSSFMEKTLPNDICTAGEEPIPLSQMLSDDQLLDSFLPINDELVDILQLPKSSETSFDIAPMVPTHNENPILKGPPGTSVVGHWAGDSYIGFNLTNSSSPLSSGIQGLFPTINIKSIIDDTEPDKDKDNNAKGDMMAPFSTLSSPSQTSQTLDANFSTNPRLRSTPSKEKVSTSLASLALSLIKSKTQRQQKKDRKISEDPVKEHKRKNAQKNRDRKKEEERKKDAVMQLLIAENSSLVEQNTVLRRQLDDSRSYTDDEGHDTIVATIPNHKVVFTETLAKCEGANELKDAILNQVTQLTKLSPKKKLSFIVDIVDV